MIIDSHLHLGYLSGFYNYDATYTALINMMESLDIGYAISSSLYSLDYGDMEKGYLMDIEAYEASKGRILSYYVYNPHEAEKSLSLMEKYANRDIFRGIKIHPSWHGHFADDEKYRPVYEYARAKKLVILSHTWTESLTNPVQKFSVPSHFEKYVSEFPDVTLILGHSGGRFEGINEAIKLGRKYPNVCFDVAGDIYIDGFVETLILNASAEKVLFGSDYPMMDPRIMLGVVMGSGISEEDKEKILCGNASRLFGIGVGREA